MSIQFIAMNGLEIWTIYERPRDYPDGYVARMWINDVPTDQVIVLPTLEPLRTMFRALGLTCLSRAEGDDPTIVECWL